MEELKRGPGKARSAVREETRTGRRREPGHTGFAKQKLTTQEIPGYVLYWSSPENLSGRTQTDDWEHVLWDEIGGRNQVGDMSISQEQLPGEYVNRRVGTTPNGSAEVYFLLKKKKEYAIADEKEKVAANNAILDQITGGDTSIENAHGSGVSIKGQRA